jgi:hypothetical protein
MATEEDKETVRRIAGIAEFGKDLPSDSLSSSACGEAAKVSKAVQAGDIDAAVRWAFECGYKLGKCCELVHRPALEALDKRLQNEKKKVKAMVDITSTPAELREKALAEYDRLQREGYGKTYSKEQVANKYTIGVRSLERFLGQRSAKL